MPKKCTYARVRIWENVYPHVPISICAGLTCTHWCTHCRTQCTQSMPPKAAGMALQPCLNVPGKQDLPATAGRAVWRFWRDCGPASRINWHTCLSFGNYDPPGNSSKTRDCSGLALPLRYKAGEYLLIPPLHMLAFRAPVGLEMAFPRIFSPRLHLPLHQQGAGQRIMQKGARGFVMTKDMGQPDAAPCCFHC